MGNTCGSCLMPFAKDMGKQEDPRYCSLCFRDGALCYTGNDLQEFQQFCYQGMRERGMNPLLAKFFTWCIRFSPRWSK